MKVLIEERDETQEYRVVSIDQWMEMVKVLDDRVLIYVPNLCGGETKITLFRSTCPDGNVENVERLRKEHQVDEK